MQQRWRCVPSIAGSCSPQSCALAEGGCATLIALVIAVAYGYIMLLGHWIEMQSVMGASNVLEELVALIPAEAHRVADNASTTDSPNSRRNSGMDPARPTLNARGAGRIRTAE